MTEKTVSRYFPTNAFVRGQVLLLVILALSVSLVIAVTVAQRTVTAFLQFTLSDSAKRAQMLAESAAENYILKGTAELELLSNVCSSAYLFGDANSLPAAPDSRCVYEPFSGVSGIISKYRAIVAVDKYPLNPGGSGEPVYFDIPKNDFGELNLVGYTGNQLQVCWNGVSDSGAGAMSDLYYFLYTDNNTQVQKRYVKCNPLNTWCVDTGPFTRSVEDSPVTSVVGSQTCFVLTSSWPMVSLRLMSLNNASKVKVISEYRFYTRDYHPFPTQGYKITAVGEQENADPSRNPRKKVSVEVSLPQLPFGFDMAVTSITDVVSGQCTETGGGGG